MKNTSAIRSVEAEGFHHGTQEVAPTAALEEIGRQFAQLKEQEKIGTADRIKSLEGKIEHIEQRKFDSDRHWVDLETQTGGMPPPILLPLCAVLFSVLVVVGETMFLAPVMDGFGIAESTWQILLAGVIVLVFSGLLEITKKQWQQLRLTATDRIEYATTDTSPRWPKVTLLGFINLLALLFVSVLGWWRAEEMLFAASAHPAEWRDFLSDNAMLTRIVVVLMTISLPVFVATAFEWGISALRFTVEWRKARREYKRFTAVLAEARKQLEGEEEKTQCRQQVLDDQCEGWKQAYLQNHELGQRVGARQMPLWQVLLKVAGVGLLLAAACLLADSLLSTFFRSDATRYLSYTSFVFGLGGIYAAYCFKAWERPNSKQLYRQQAVNWRSTPGERSPLSETKKKSAFGTDAIHELSRRADCSGGVQ